MFFIYNNNCKLDNNSIYSFVYYFVLLNEEIFKFKFLKENFTSFTGRTIFIVNFPFTGRLQNLFFNSCQSKKNNIAKIITK